MTRKIRVCTTSLATLEDVKPPYNLRHPTAQENLDLGLSLLDAAGQQGVDLVCLPESFLSAGMPYTGAAISSAAQTIPGPAYNAIADCARRYRMYVVAGLPVLTESGLRNMAMVIDRGGILVGTYAKMHPTEGEINCGVVPGTEPAVIETDFGRVGLAICFDLNWPEQWAAMAAQQADLVCWLSAYPGGFPLRAYAWMHAYRVVSAVWPYESRIIDITGRILTATTRWGRLAVCDLDIDKRVYHTDGQAQYILPIQARYGRKVWLETFSEEHLFTLECNDPELTVGAIEREYGLIEYRAYIARCSAAQQHRKIPLH